MDNSAAAGEGPGGSPANWSARDQSFGYRLLLRAYPRWFRVEFGTELIRYLTRQRAEQRYRGTTLGTLRFWRHAVSDAVSTGVSLRVDQVRERWKNFRRKRPNPDNRGQGRRFAMTIDAIMRDLKHALRGLGKNPGYTLVFIVTLGLGIGANAAIFSAVNGVLLRPLPHEDGDRLVYLRHTARLANLENVLFSVPEIDDYRQGSRALEAVAEFSAMTFTMLGFDTPRRVRAGIVTGNYFDVMGLRATLGRTIGREDDGADARAVIVLSDAYWRRAFGGDSAIIGKTVDINGRSATFIGIAEPAPPYPERTDVYVNMATSPHHLSATMSTDRIHRMTEVFARLSAEATIESARTEVATITSRIHTDHPEAYDAGSGFDVTVTPLKTQLTSRARPTLLLLLATVALVLIIACANLANLTLTRVLRRGHELSIRASLGGSRAALRRALLMENIVLAIAGAGLGLVIAFIGFDLLVSFAERFTVRASEIALDGSVLGFVLVAAVVVSVLFTLVPPLPGGDSGAFALARSGTRSTGHSRAKWAQRALVVAQISMSFMLLIGAGLLFRTMRHLNNIDPGFDMEQVLAMDVPSSDWESTPPAQFATLYESILRDVDALPSVESAALTSAIPLTSSSGGFTTQWLMEVEGYEPAPGVPSSRADFRVVSRRYFDTMGIEVLRGRGFMTTDIDDAQKVVVINESMANAYFGDRDPIGYGIAWTDDIFRFMGLQPEYRTIVGVVEDTRDAGLDASVVHTVYHPYRQFFPQFTQALVVRVRGDPSSVIPSIREVILGHDPTIAIDNVATVADLGNASVAQRRLNATLLGVFAVLALAIAAVGIGGVLAFSVGNRLREFGIRSALGAARYQVWSGVVTEGATLAGIGIALGGILAVLLTRFISGLLFGVPALDPVTFVAVGLLLVGVAVVAAWVPAWRAAAVSPIEVLSAD